MNSMLSMPIEEGIYSVSLVTDIEGFEALGDQWELLLQEIGENNINQSHHWLLTWLKYFAPGSLFVVLVYNKSNHLVGAAPLMIRCSPRGLGKRILRHVQFIGTDPDVYDGMQILTLPGEDTTLILSKVAEQLLKHRSLWDVIDLRYCLDRSQLEIIQQYLMPKTVHQSLTYSMSIPYFQLPESIEVFDTQFVKKSARKSARNVRNHLKNDFPDAAPTLQFQAPSTVTDETFDRFFRHHMSYWTLRGKRSDFERFKSLSAFYKAIHKIYHNPNNPYGRVQFSTLQIDDRILSYQIVFLQGNNYMGHIATYDPASRKYRPGFLHLEALIHHAIESGVKSFSLGRGNEGYKDQWASQEKELWNLLMLKTPRSLTLWQLDVFLLQSMGYVKLLRSKLFSRKATS